ncbi:hypothetical protein [Candidatus Thiodiazotropha sp. LNASS1]|uniref:hypothetical protein n=1 Tax=Candidatus Thiodiazotropha sp. LNASS1 TaxID=3096260 RepID=UPI0034DF300A
MNVHSSRRNSLLPFKFFSQLAIFASMMSCFAIALAGEWELPPEWQEANLNSHQIVVARGDAVARWLPVDEHPSIAPHAHHLSFGLMLLEGRIDLRFREAETAAYRLRFEVHSGPLGPSVSATLSTTAPGEPDKTLVENVLKGFELKRWYAIGIEHRVVEDEDYPEPTISLEVKVDGATVLTTHSRGPLPPGGTSFRSFSSSNAYLDIFHDKLDAAASELRKRPIAQGFPNEHGAFITANRDVFYETYTSMGRHPVLVPERQVFAHRFVQDRYLGQNYVLPEAISSSPAPKRVVQSGVHKLWIPKSLEEDNPVIFGLTPHETNFLNDPGRSTVLIWGVNLGNDWTWIYLGDPLREGALKAKFPVLRPAEGDFLPELEFHPEIGRVQNNIQVVRVDLSKLAPGGMPFEGEALLRVQPPHREGYFSNDVPIYLRSKWKSRPMFVGMTKRFNIDKDEGGDLDGIPEHKWTLGGSTVVEPPSTSTGAQRMFFQTGLHFPYRQTVPWESREADWPAEIPVFARKESEMSEVLSLSLAGVELDEGWASDLAAFIFKAIGKGMENVPSKNDPGWQKLLWKGGGELAKELGDKIKKDGTNDPMGALVLAYPEDQFYGAYNKGGLVDIASPDEGSPRGQVDFVVRHVDAPYVKSVKVKVNKIRWISKVEYPSTIKVTNDIYLLARAGIGFRGGKLNTGTSSGVRTKPKTVQSHEWVVLSSNEQIILDESFDRKLRETVDVPNQDRARLLSQLNARNIPDEIANIFYELLGGLSDQANIDVVVHNSEWEINDGGRRYFLSFANDMIGIYENPPVVMPFLYVEFALWDKDGALNDDDNFGGAYTRLYLPGDEGMKPDRASVRSGPVNVRIDSVGFPSYCEIEYEYAVERETGP